jgi:hypothetical protein
MPQLDTVLFFPQLCWFFLFFILFYVLIIQVASPLIFISKKLAILKNINHLKSIVFLEYINVNTLYLRKKIFNQLFL